jgi:hypothetical protein
MRKQLLVLSAVVLSSFVQAQEPVYRWGPPATNDHPERRIERMLALGDDGFVLLRASEDATTVKHYWLEHYDGSLAHQATVEVPFNVGVMGDAQFLDDVTVVNGVIYAFVTHWNKAAGEHTLKLHELDLGGSLKELATLDVIKAEKMGNRGTYRWSFSSNGSKLMVLSELPFVKGTMEKLRLTCYGLPQVEKLWAHEQELEFEADRGAAQQVAVDDVGRAYLYKKSWQKPLWVYRLYGYDGKGSWKSHPVTGPEGMELEDVHLGFDPANACVVYATYTTKPSAYSKELHGSYFARFGYGLDLETSRIQAWPADMVAHFSGERNAANTDKARLDDFGIKDVLHRSDGRILVLMEQVRTENKAIAGSSPMQFSYSWNYGDLLVLCLDPRTGDPVWWQGIDKRQEVRNTTGVDEYGSVVYHLRNDRLYVLWNNTELSVPSIPPANWEEPDGTRYVKHKAFDPATMHGTFLHVIEPDGKLAYIDRKYGLPLFNLHQGAVFEMSLSPQFFFNLHGDLVIMATMHNGGKRYRFGFIGL